MLKAFDATLDLARELGATVETMHLPHAPHALAAYYLIAPAECSSNLARYDGVRFGFRAADATATCSACTRKTREAGFGAEVKRRIMLGTYALSSGYYDAYYGRAQKVRTLIARGLHDRVGEASTSSSRRPRRASPSSSAPRPPTRWRCTSTTSARCRCRSPASRRISIPNGLSEGLPVGFQIAGPAFSENRLLDAAFALEQAIGFDGIGGVRMTHVRTRHRAGDPRPAQDAHEDVLRLRAELRRGAQHAHLPGLPRPARDAAGDQRPGRRLRDHDGPGARLRDRAAVDLPPQELLLSGPLQGLPDLPVRHPAVPRRAAGRRAHPPHPPRGGRGQARPRRASRAASTAPTRRSSTTTAAARRWPRSSPSPTSTRPSRPATGCSCCARRCASSASAT